METFKNRDSNNFETAIIEAESLTPAQQYSTAKRLQVSANTFFQRFIKFPHIAIFHSYSELLHAALLESNPDVSSFVPQPLKFMIQNRRYIPDCYYVHKSERYVVEVKPEGKFEEKLEVTLEAYLKSHGINFKLVTNESILEQERLALNWLHIVRTLISAQQYCTDEEEQKLTERISIQGDLELGNIINFGNRLKQNKSEIALYRLAHQGVVKLDIGNENINYSTGVSLCC